MKGRVWPGNSVFPDLFNPRSMLFHRKMMSYLEEQIDFDGIWLDMNEIANFCVYK